MKSEFILKLKNKRLVIISSTFVILFVSSILGISSIVSAESYSGTVFSRTTWMGYFDNKKDTSGTSVLPEIYSAGHSWKDAIRGDVTSPDTLIAFLKQYNNYWGNTDLTNRAQEATGSAFIVCTMFGYTADECVDNKIIDSKDGRKVADWAWAELKNRLVDRQNKNKIQWNAQVEHCNFINSYYQDDQNDDAFYRKADCANNPDGTKRFSIRIYNDNGTLAYEIFRYCANPLGNLPGIPTVPEVPKTYNLSPSITASPSLVSVGGTVNLKSTIKYSGDVSSPANTTWKVYKSINGGNSYSVSPIYTNIGSISKNISFSVDDSLSSGLAVGTRVCYRLGITPHSNDDSSETFSDPSCITVSDKPKVQVLGGDLMVGGLVNTSTSTISGSIYGSWDEYGILAGKSISGMASAAAFAGGFSGSINTASSYSKLSFNNTNNTNSNCKSSSTIGCYLTSTSLPDVASSFTTTSSTPVLSSGSLTSVASGVYKINSNISISASTITKGKWIVINAVGKTITITGDIKYTDDTLHSISEIPQVIIIADNINISDSVTNIDSWLIAKNGYINTCSAVAIGEKLSSNVCNKQLTVNGPVVANQLYLRRTYTGTGDTPAEIFNLPEDTYLWSYAHASDNTRIQTVYTTELPPRL